MERLTAATVGGGAADANADGAVLLADSTVRLKDQSKATFTVNMKNVFNYSGEERP